MPTECTNSLSAYYVHLGYGQVSIVVLAVAILYWIMSIVIMYWIKLQERIAQSIHEAENASYDDDSSSHSNNDVVGVGGGGNTGAKSVIFPVFVDVMWINSFLNIAVGILLLTIEDPDTYDQPTLRSTVIYSIIWGLQHFLIEGVAFLLMQKGLGLNSALKAVKWGIVWGAITGWMKFSTYYYTTQAANGYRLAWEVVLIVFYLFLWLFPQKHFFRRPAAVVYGRCWFVFRLISLISAIFLTRRQTRSVGSCVYIYAPMFIFSILQPYVTYYTLLLDSWWWQGMLDHAADDDRNALGESGLVGEKWGSIVSPMQGLNMNLNSAQSLAETLDMLKSRATNAVKLLNFAYIKLDTAKLLGQGSFSKVYRGQYKQQECAVKLIFTVDLTVDVINRVAAESQILSSLRSVNVVNILGVAVLPPSMCILLEMCKYGSLADVVKGRREGKKWHYKPLSLSTIDLYYLALGCTRGLKAIHQLGNQGSVNSISNSTGASSRQSRTVSLPLGGTASIKSEIKMVRFCHRDVKSLNFLVDSQLNAKVADLELGQEGSDQGHLREWGGATGAGFAANQINYADVFPILHRSCTVAALGIRSMSDCVSSFCVSTLTLNGNRANHRRGGGGVGGDWGSDRSSFDTESDMERGTLNNSGIRLSSRFHGDSNSSHTSALNQQDNDDVSVGHRSKHSVSQLSMSNASKHSMIHMPTDDGILPNWDPPEAMLDRKAYTQKSDIYSFGLVLWELFSREIPYEKGELVSLPRPKHALKATTGTVAITTATTTAATATATGMDTEETLGSTEHYSTGLVPPGLLKRDTVSMLVRKGYRPNLSTEPIDLNAQYNSTEMAAVAALTETEHYGAVDQYGQYTYNIPYKLRLLIAQCWLPNPNDRPSLNRIAHCLEHLLGSSCYDFVTPKIELPSDYAYASVASMLTQTKCVRSSNSRVGSVDSVGNLASSVPTPLAPASGPLNDVKLFQQIFGGNCSSGSSAISINNGSGSVSCINAPNDTLQIPVPSNTIQSTSTKNLLTTIWNKLDIESRRQSLFYCVFESQSPFRLLRASDQWLDEFGYSRADIGLLKLDELFTRLSPRSPLREINDDAPMSPMIGSLRPASLPIRGTGAPTATSASPAKAPELDNEQLAYLKRFFDTMCKGKSDHIVMPVSNAAVGPSQLYSIFSYPLQLCIQPSNGTKRNDDISTHDGLDSISTPASTSVTAAKADGDIDDENDDSFGVFHDGRFDSNTEEAPMPLVGSSPRSPSPTGMLARSQQQTSVGSLSQSFILNNAFGWLRNRSTSRSPQPLSQQGETSDIRTTSTTGLRGTGTQSTTSQYNFGNDSLFSGSFMGQSLHNGKGSHQNSSIHEDPMGLGNDPIHIDTVFVVFFHQLDQ